MRKIVILGGVTDIQMLKHKLNTGEAQRRYPHWSGRKDNKGAYRPPQYEEKAKFKHNIALIRDEKTSVSTVLASFELFLSLARLSSRSLSRKTSMSRESS